MIANLFVNSNTFKFVANSSEEEVFMKLLDFSELVSCVYSNFEDVIYIDQNNFYETEVLPSVTMADLLFQNNDCYSGKDILDIILEFLSKFKQIPDSISNVTSYINNPENCAALIVFNKLSDGSISDSKQILSNKKDFICFHRNCLITFPELTTESFLEEAKLCFSNLVIHSDNKISLKSIYKSHLRQIVLYLGIMNDFLISEFYDDDRFENNFVEFLKVFKTKHSEIEDASFQGGFNSQQEKKKFEKDFIVNGRLVKCYCEAHLKMYHDDNRNIKHGRIYFKSIKKGDTRVYIGVIKDHL
ncbi:MAG: hypothetical protein MJ176_00675 [Treponema sp.]|nr:hypothetical protein [Treponema sp.]